MMMMIKLAIGLSVLAAAISVGSMVASIHNQAEFNRINQIFEARRAAE